MSRGPDLGTQLERALVRSAADAGIALSVVAITATPWASVTFTGARHRIVAIATPCPLLDSWLVGLGETEFRLRGHLVADLAVTGSIHAEESAEVTIEVLTVEDC
ncbi:hypothetical protein [Sphingomonas sp.]|uniref:hypothetical protein n=1 Tax=Sphingomonas sp. TaxID=28214 RepID=UPI002EDA1418